uniref:Uncharacterized protein n=1 Tax=Arundo donax TaxID=35708 RepID=A0A0A9CTD2_ARUDO
MGSSPSRWLLASPSTARPGSRHSAAGRRPASALSERLSSWRPRAYAAAPSGSSPETEFPASESTRSSDALRSVAGKLPLRPFPERSRWRRCSTRPRSAGSVPESCALGRTRLITRDTVAASDALRPPRAPAAVAVPYDEAAAAVELPSPDADVTFTAAAAASGGCWNPAQTTPFQSHGAALL